MKDKIRKLKSRKYAASIVLVILFFFVLGLISLLKPYVKNINIKNVLSKTTSLNASVNDAVSEGVTSNNYDEIKYQIRIDKDSDDEAVIIGTLTNSENKFARFKSTKEGVVSDNGKKITVTTKKEKVKITVVVENAPYGTTIDPVFKINSEEENKSNVDVEPVIITGKSVEGIVTDEDGNLYSGVELSLSSNGEEVKRTYTKSEGDYVFSLGDTNAYQVEVKEDKYQVVRYSEATTDENRRILNVVIKEVEPFKLSVKKTINKLDLVINGNKQTYTYDDASIVSRSVKGARTIEGSIYYNISIKNEGEIKGTLTALKDVIPEGLSFDESKNPGWTKDGNNLFYTVLEGTEIEGFGKANATLVLDIVKTDAAKNYINTAIASGDDYKYVVYYLDNSIYREEYVIANEKVKDINPGVANFAGWYTDKNYTNKFNFNNGVNKDLVLFGKIENNKYTITFVDINPNNNQETILDIVEVNEGETTNLVVHPEYQGYTFKCFKVSNSCYNDDPIYEDTTIYTSYDANEYEIDYYLDGGVLSDENPTRYTVRDEFTLYRPSKEGFTFIGWTGTDLTEPTLDVTITRGSIGDREYTANYEINRSSLTIDPNGGTYEDNSSSVSFTEDYGTVKAISESVRRGYDFLGYTHTGGGSYQDLYYTFDNDDGTLTAEYEIIPYRITYSNITDAERAALNNKTEYNVETDTFTLKNPDTRVDGDNNPTKDFVGWNDGNGNTSLTVTIPKGSIGDRTYTAVWADNTKEYGIAYELHNGVYETGKTNPSTYTRQTPTFRLNNPSKTGYNFIGWSGTGLTGNANTNVTIEQGSAGNRAYEANYEVIEYTITYDYDDGVLPVGTSNPDRYTVESDTINLINPTKVGYTFEGWSGTDITGKSTSVSIPHGSTGNRTYKANFKKIEYSLTYTLNGGAYETGKTNPDKYSIESDDITLNNPSKTGYTFKGWSGTDLTGDENTLVVISHGSIGHRSFLANYTPITYRITYDYVGGALPDGVTNPSEYTIESDEITFNAPVKEGYTFKNYKVDNVITPSIPTGSTGDKHLVADYEIEHYTVNYYSDNVLYATETVDWDNQATKPAEDPTKSHNIFLYWTEDGTNPYNFNTHIKTNKDLYAVFEEVEIPTITIDPTLDDLTNRTWVCSDSSNNDCGVTVTITSDHNDYELYYKIGDNSAVLYTGPFKVYENETVYAFAKKSNIYSANAEETINNVDSIAPTINQPATGSMSFNMTVSGTAQDAGSGVKKFTLYVKEKDAILWDDTLTYESETFEGIRDHAENYDHTFYGVHDNTEYIVKIVAEDYVGNISEREVEVTTHPYVARVVGKNGILWYTVDPDTKEFVIDDGKEFLMFDSIQAAVDYCAEVQCTIQTNPIMPVVDESVIIASNQNITIDLDGRGIVSDDNATFVNNGKLQIVDRNPRLNDQDEHESIGKVINTTDRTIVNNNIFILGDGSSEPGETFIYPEMDRPIIEGVNNALEQNNLFYFYDGKLVSVGTVILDRGEDAITQYSYNAILSGEDDKNIAILDKVTDPEARIKSTYYAKLKVNNNLNAFDSARTGTMSSESAKMLSKIRQSAGYGFIYDEVNDQIYNGNQSTANTTAQSYIKLDLTGELEDQFITFDAFADTYNSNSYGYISVSETLGQTGTQIYKISGNDATENRVYSLKKGKVYYIYFGFVKAGGDVNPDEKFIVSNFRILGEREATNNFRLYTSPGYYGFSKQEDGRYLSNNKGIDATTAQAYSIFDMRSETEDVVLRVTVSNTIGHKLSTAWIYVTDDVTVQGSGTETGRYYYMTSSAVDRTVNITLHPGEIYYVHFGYYNHYDGSGGFSIDSIAFTRTTGFTRENHISETEVTHNSGDSYYFENIEYDTWSDLTGGKAATVFGATLNEEQNGYIFDGNDYAMAIGGIASTALTSESVELEFSTTRTSNQIYYIGSSNQNIAIGTWSNYIIVSNKNTATTYAIPENLADGEKHKITITYDEGTYNAYFDNEPMTLNGTTTNYFGGATSNLIIGKREYNDNYFVGTIYGLKVYNRALSSEEISNPSVEGLIYNLDGTNSIKTRKNGYRSTNIGGHYNNAHGYVVYDLTDVDEDKYLYVNTAMSRLYGSGYVAVSNSASVPSGTSGRAIDYGSTVDNQSGILRLTKNKVNYVHFYYSNNYNEKVRYKDFFLIKELRYCDTLEDAYSASAVNYSKVSNYYFEKPIVNEKVDTIELLKDITLNTTITVPQEKEVILDLNGHVLTSDKDDYIIKNYGNLEIKDSVIEEKRKQNLDYITEQARLFEEARTAYLEDLAEYNEYIGLCDGCEPSDEYKLDNFMDYADYFGINIADLENPDILEKTDYSYTGAEETLVAPETALYKLQVWGAQGGYRSYSTDGGKGGYSEGIIELKKGETIYINVGGSGNTGGTAGGFNGGGSKTTYPGGGGATDIRVEGNSLYNRIIVAGGGGSDGAVGYSGKAGGGLSGVTATETSYCSGGEGGTQTSAGTRGSFGQGGSGGYHGDGWGGGGFGGAGGGGWYGGGGVNPDRSDDDRGGGGGSGFVYTNPDVLPVSGYLVKNHILTDATTIVGTGSVPTYDGTSTMIGNSGDGYAKITATLLIPEDMINEIRANLEKTYSVKKQPIFKNYIEGIDFDDSIDINTLTPESTPTYSDIVEVKTTGSITTTINNAILNEQYATLIIDTATINVNVNSKYGIVNRGALTINEDAIINANNSSTKGIYNETNAELSGKGTINAKGSSSIGLLNRSNTAVISDINVTTTQTNATAIRNESLDDVIYSNINVTGSGLGFGEFGVANTTIINSRIKSTGNNAVNSLVTSLPVKLDIISSNISGTLNTDYSTRIVNVSNSTLTSVSNYLGYVVINNSTLNSISNSGKVIVNGSTLSGSGTLINNNSTDVGSGRSGTQSNSNLIIRNSIINSTATSAVTVVKNNNDMLIDGTTFNNVNNAASTAISNSAGSDNGAYLTIAGNTTIAPSYGTAISNSGTLTLGTNEENAGTTYEYGYTGYQEEFVAPEDGLYKLETWGASGGRIRSYSYDGFWLRGGFGAYASGVIYLNAGDKLYIHVGQAGTYGDQLYGTYNGGGRPGGGGINHGAGSSGGGATDISLSNEDNVWSYDNGSSISKRSNASYEQRIIVAGGGGVCRQGSSMAEVYNPNYNNCSGGYPATARLGYADVSGGGGYYGGTETTGGSSYVSDTLSNAVMLTGNQEMPDYTSSGLIKGNIGNGYAKITMVTTDGENVTTTPTISAVNYGITGSGKVIYRDGTINAKTAVNSDIYEVPEDYDIYNSLDTNSNEKMILVANSNSRPVESGEEFVAAIGNAKYTTIQNAIDASNNGDEIDLLVNIEQQNMINIPEDKVVNIDYNGHTVKSYNNQYLYNNLGNLTITDSQNALNKNVFMGDKYIYNEGTLNVSNIYISNSSYTVNLIQNNGGTATLDSIKVDFGSSISSKVAMANSANGTLIIKNSTLNLYNANNMINNLGSLTFKDNTVTGSANASVVVNEESGTAILDGNAYSVSGNDDNGRYFINNKGNATIKNMSNAIEDFYNTGVLTLEDNNITSGTVTSSGLLIINNGTYSNAFKISGSGKSIDDTDNMYSMIIHDGNFTKTLNISATGISSIEGGSIVVTSGAAISNSGAGVINLGIHDGVVDVKENTRPIITGITYGINTSNPDLVVNYYDGIVTAQRAYNVTVEDIETGYSIRLDYDSENDIETKYLTDEPMFENVVKDVRYKDINELNNALENGLVDDDDVIRAYRNITISKGDNPITIPDGLNITFDINGKTIDKNNNTFFINNGNLTIIDDVNDSTGRIDSTVGSIFINDGTLNISSGTFVSEKSTIESEIVKNNENATLNISGGTLTKYYDKLGYRRVNSGAIINNSGNANITGGTYYANGSFVEAYWRRVGDYTDYIYTSAIFVNSETGILDVTGGTFDGITSNVWNDEYSEWRSAYTDNKGELIYNSGTATFTGITASSTGIGRNTGTLTFDHVTMSKVNALNSALNSNRGSHHNLFNTGTINVVDSSFTVYTPFVNNYGGTVNITNSTIDKAGNGAAYRTSGDDSWGGNKNSHVIRNYNVANGEINVVNSEIYNRGSGEVFDNAQVLNITNSTITSNNNNAINTSTYDVHINKSNITAKNTAISTSSGNLYVIGEGNITSTSGVAISLGSTVTLTLGEPITEDGGVSKVTPVIKGNTYAITNSGTIYFYDGILMGKTNTVSGIINNIELGYMIIDDIDGDYKTNYLDRIPVIQNITQATALDEKKYYDLETAFYEADDGDILQMIANYSNLPTDTTAVNDHNITFDLNGKYIRQANSLLLTNNSNLYIVDSSEGKSGEIQAISGTKVIDNYGDITMDSGKIRTSTFSKIIDNYEDASITLRDNAKLISTRITTLINNDGTVNIYNGAYLQNHGGNSNHFYVTNDGLPMILNNGTLNIIDFNNDDDDITSSEYQAPQLYSVDNALPGSIFYWSVVAYYDSIVRNTSGSNLTIYGGIFNNGSTTSPTPGKILWNEGTAKIKNLDNYSYMIGYNTGTLDIEDSYLHNIQAGALICEGGTTTVKNTTIHMEPNTYGSAFGGNNLAFKTNNTTFDHVTFTGGITTNTETNVYLIRATGYTEIIDSSIDLYAKGNVIQNNSTLVIRNTQIKVDKVVENYGTLTLDNSSITSTVAGIYNESKLDLINGSTVTATSTGISIASGTVNIPSGTSVTSSEGNAISISNGTVNIGEIGGVPDVETPLIQGATFGVYRTSTGNLNFYDGLLIGGSGPNAVYGGVTNVESGYEIEDVLDPNDNLHHEYLTVSATSVAVATVGTYTFSANSSISPSKALQNAINFAIGDGTNVRNVNLVTNVDLVNDEYSITASAPVTINTNGNTINTDDTYNLDSKITLNTSEVGGSISKLLGDVFDINSNPKNILIYELSDGSELDTTKTYKLYRDNALIGLEKVELGRYKYKGKTEELMPIKGRLYLDNLNKGSYRLVSSDNKSIEFSIDESGNISGNVVEYNHTDDKSSSAISTAELILSIQTGMTRHYYLLLLIPIISIIITLMIIIRYNKKREI